MAITVQPYWWETWWFRAGGILTGIGMLYVIVKRREHSIKQEERNKVTLRQQMVELESRALRAQMNPHFIFNSLNSIQEAILSNNTDAACDYLSKFAKLIRLILENSEKQFISLNQELDAIRLYVELEALRSDHSFEYRFDVDPALEHELFMIPSMLIQPYIENAIWHGLFHKPGDRVLHLQLKSEGTTLVCIVEDNGIGRAKSAEKKSKFKKDYESKGMRVTGDRLALLNAINPGRANVNIIDLKDALGEPAGTRVELRIALDN